MLLVENCVGRSTSLVFGTFKANMTNTSRQLRPQVFDSALSASFTFHLGNNVHQNYSNTGSTTVGT